MKEHKNLIANLHEHAQWAEANEWETPIMLSDDLKEAADLIERQAAEIDAAQTVDAVEVVRCKDCKHSDAEFHKDGLRYCMRGIKADDYNETGYIYPIEEVVRDVDFCSYGERSDENAAD